MKQVENATQKINWWANQCNHLFWCFLWAVTFYTFHVKSLIPINVAFRWELQFKPPNKYMWQYNPKYVSSTWNHCCEIMNNADILECLLIQIQHCKGEWRLTDEWNRTRFFPYDDVCFKRIRKCKIDADNGFRLAPPMCRLSIVVILERGQLQMAVLMGKCSIWSAKRLCTYNVYMPSLLFWWMIKFSNYSCSFK